MISSQSTIRIGFLGFALVLGGAALGVFEPARAADRPPNVLLVMTDDQGWGDVRCHGNPLIDTPTMDLLAGQGARFDRFFVSPVCAPTRASLLTGRYHLSTGASWVTGGLEVMDDDEITIAEVLRDAGYATGCFGKWHNGAAYPYHPNGQGFESFFGFCAGHWNNYFDTTLERNGEPERTEGYITDVLTDEAIAFMTERRDRPFFCYVPYNTPHGPFQVPDRYFDKYKERGCDDRLAAVYGMVENIDDNLARLLATLEELDLEEETIVLFLTDNGANTDRYDGFMRGRKASVHEGGSRVPLFIRWPGRIAPGTTVGQLTAHIDLMPTLLELCGVEPPEEIEFHGRGLAPLLDGYEPDWPERLLFTHQYHRNLGYVPSHGTARSIQYRYVLERDRHQLYDLVADPREERDLAEEKPELTRRFARAYADWFERVTARGDEPPPIPVGHPERPQVTLPAPEADFEGSIRFWASAGWANDWLTDWTSTEDRITWDIDVVEPGRYDVELLYTCPAADVGSVIEVQSGDSKTQARVETPHDPDPIPSPDRVPRGRVTNEGHWRGEAYEKEWKRLPVGTLELEAGEQELSIRALEVPGERVIDLKGVRLIRKP